MSIKEFLQGIEDSVQVNIPDRPDAELAVIVDSMIQDRIDAERWRSLTQHAVIRSIGSAGFNRPPENPAGNYRFLTLELWSQYPNVTTEPRIIEMLTEFVNAAASAAKTASKPAAGVSDSE